MKLRNIMKQIIAESANKSKLNEAVKGLNLEQPVSNLFIKGWGNDTNGNLRIIVGFPNDKGFPIQTNGNLPETHYILNRKTDKDFTDDELKTIGKEITNYTAKYGGAVTKNKLSIYGKK